jgi:hypothetical protein
MFITLKKSTLYLYSKCVFWRLNQNALYSVHALYFTRAKLGLADDFPQHFSSITPWKW